MWLLEVFTLPQEYETYLGTPQTKNTKRKGFAGTYTQRWSYQQIYNKDNQKRCPY